MSTNPRVASNHAQSTPITISGESGAALDNAETPLTYELLTRFHMDQIRQDGEGKLRPPQSLKNQRSNINRWIEFNRLDSSSPVGDELGINFAPVLADFCAHLKLAGNSGQTVSDRKCTVQQLRESYEEFLRSTGLPAKFGPALHELVERAGESPEKIARRAGIRYSILLSWLNGVKPSKKSLKLIGRLENYFEVPRGTLSSRLPEAHWRAKKYESGMTEWRKHVGRVRQLRYVMKQLPKQAQEEWAELLDFHSSDEWPEAHGMSRNSSWRVRWNTNRCETGKIKLNMLKGYFGYLCLPEGEPDRRMRGHGLTADSLTIALLSDARLVRSYLHFLRARTHSGNYNSYTLNFISFACQTLRPKTGYLWQSPQYAAKLPQPISTDEWRNWCEKNREELINFEKKIRGGKEGKLRKTRDPFAGVKEIIEMRQHPITGLFDVVKSLESLTPLLLPHSPVKLALHCRDIFLLRFIASNPLRIENFSMMTFIPKEMERFVDACELYRSQPGAVSRENFVIETDAASNLYQRPDGSWWLRFSERDFKNEKGDDIEKGVLHAPYDVLVVPSVWPALREYLFIHRPIINQALKERIKEYRHRNNLPPLNPSEELKIERCAYVFRSAKSVNATMSLETLAAFTGTEQINKAALSQVILSKTQRFLPDCPGFSPNACRHLVATEYIKNRPDGEDVAAAALHNTVQMVRKHYAWVTPADRIKPWNDYHEDQYRKYEDGEI